jgi:transposase
LARLDDLIALTDKINQDINDLEERMYEADGHDFKRLQNLKEKQEVKLKKLLDRLEDMGVKLGGIDRSLLLDE